MSRAALSTAARQCAGDSYYGSDDRGRMEHTSAWAGTRGPWNVRSPFEAGCAGRGPGTND